MILYNITFNAEKSVSDQWKAWAQAEYVLAADRSEHISEHRFLKMMHESQGEGDTYALQLYAKGLSNLEKFFEQHAHIPAQMGQKFGEKVVSFATILEEV